MNGRKPTPWIIPLTITLARQFLPLNIEMMKLYCLMVFSLVDIHERNDD